MTEKVNQIINTVEFKFLLSLLVGFLIGLEREIRGRLGEDLFAGIRTFPLIAGLGTLSAWISERFFAAFLPLSYGAVLLLSAINYYGNLNRKKFGITTEVAVFLTFTFGVLIYFGYYYESVFFAVVITFLLALKRWLEGFAKHLDSEDIILILQFLTVTVLIFPLLPDREIFYGLNPHRIWKFVILVSSISFVGYMLLKVYVSKGETKGVVRSIFAISVLGGSVSSTAVTIAFAQISRELPQIRHILLVGIAVAWAVMALRVVVLGSIIDPRLFPPFLALMLPFAAAMLLYAYTVYKRAGWSEFETPSLPRGFKLENPLSWGKIAQFTAVYAAVAVLSKYLNAHYGSKGLLLLSATSGVIDVDPITLSLSTMFANGQVSEAVVAYGVLLATISNNFFKALYAFLFGERGLKRLVLHLAVINLVYGILAGLALIL
jgi:uncharacterized membrane protein (DUF4010 family)